jgi:hypothetical protein
MSASSVGRSVPLNVLTGGRITVAALAVLTPRIGARIFRMTVEGTPAVAMGRMFGIRNAALATAVALAAAGLGAAGLAAMKRTAPLSAI